MNSPRIALDVDGVLCQFHERALSIMKSKFGLQHVMDDFETWDVTRLLKRKEDRDVLNEMIRSPGFAALLDPYPEAIKAVRRLRKAGVEVIFVTTPNYVSTTWMWERKLWLNRYFDAPEEDVVFVHRKSIVRADALVDDKPSTIESWMTENQDGRAMLWDAPYNRQAVLPRVYAWEEVLEHFGA